MTRTRAAFLSLSRVVGCTLLELSSTLACHRGTSDNGALASEHSILFTTAQHENQAGHDDFWRFAAACATLPVRRFPDDVMKARSPSRMRRQPDACCDERAACCGAFSCACRAVWCACTMAASCARRRSRDDPGPADPLARGTATMPESLCACSWAHTACARAAGSLSSGGGGGGGGGCFDCSFESALRFGWEALVPGCLGCLGSSGLLAAVPNSVNCGIRLLVLQSSRAGRLSTKDRLDNRAAACTSTFGRCVSNW